ncbi:uncharacterized protein LOC132872105 [Neoarius graeffei]|uniref:uncharacterized protein LOC132872105 n=1 Tax=Neoarius graeffei TaxID=443677 RepID=UPI00298D4607|nr:uncharacterized protein LOC132872105 [Neoarius graeffei]
MAKSLEELKTERTTAKRLFSRLANCIARTHSEMTVEELKQNLNKLTAESSRLMEANEEIEAAYMAEAAAAAVEDLGAEKKADLEKIEAYCKQRTKEAKLLIQQTLWESYGEKELPLALYIAEADCKNVSSAQLDVTLEAYEFMLKHFEMLVLKAKEAHRDWNRWAPAAEQRDFDHRMTELEVQLPQLVSRKAAFIKAAKIKTESEESTVHRTAPVPAIKLKATALPKFAGNQRSYYRWKKEWEALQKQGELTGSREVKKFQLLDSIDEKVAENLHLSTYSSSNEIFRVLDNRFGNQANIALEIIEDLQATPAVKAGQPRRVIELIQTVEKALYDLNELDNAKAIKNPIVTKSIEGKLPETLKKDWLTYAADVSNAVDHHNRFDKLLAYLKSQEAIYEQLDQLKDGVEPAKDKTKFLKQARTKATNNPAVSSNGDAAGCIICGDPKHRRKLYFCRKFRTDLKPSEKRDAAQQLSACKRCLEVHAGESCKKTTYLCGNPECKDQHHFLLCPVTRPQSQRTPKFCPVRAKGRRLTETQEQFLSKLTPELAQQCRDAFCNIASRAFNSSAAERGLLDEHCLTEYPVILMLLNVTANDGQSVGTLIDLASDTNYITHKAASKLNLRSEDVTLVVHGVGGMKVSVATKRYLLKIRVSTPRGTLKAHQLICYGLDKIAEVHRHVPAKKLQKIFSDISLEDLARPKEIQLLISHKEGQLVPQKVRSVGDLVLWDGPLGKTIGGTHPDLFEEVTLTAHTSKTHFARSMRTAAVIGDKPAGCIAQVAMRETASLPSFNHFKEERRVLKEDAYVDDILTSHNNLDHLKCLTSNIEQILQAGGFFMNPWIYSDQSGRSKSRGEKIESNTMILPNQLTEEDNKALGLGYTVDDDKLHVMVAVNYSKKRKKMRLGQDLLKEQVREQTPLDHKGDPVKAEVCGAVFAARLENYFQKHCRIEVKRWYHLVDSQTILGAIQRESYGYQTFYANRVGEIQSSTDIRDWWWIPGAENIADIITRGASPDDLIEKSKWQSGPQFLQLPESEWPKKSAKDVAAQARDVVTKMQKKTFTAVLT